MASIDLARARTRASDVLAGFTLGQKVVTLLGVAGLALGGLVVLRWASQPSLAPLFTDLAPADAAAITEELDATGVDYELVDGGRTILVPRDGLYDLRLDMSAQGLPTASTGGYALLDQQGITTSEFRQRIDYQRALEGELARTIGAIDGLAGATVHLVIPEQDLFADDAQRPSASVLLQPEAGGAVDPASVQAIVHLVAQSVEGLEPTEVTVADSTGRIHQAPGDDGVAAAAGDARALQTASFEERLATSVEEMLGEVVGTGGAVVRVNAVLDFDRRSTVTERFGDEEGITDGITLSQQQTSETYVGVGADQVGVLGPDGQVTTADGEETDYQLNDAATTFAVDRVVQEVVAAPGAVQRLSVAVLLDEGIDVAEAGDVQRLVEAAVGFDAQRGDIIEVGAMPFDTSAEEEAAAAMEEATAAERQREMMSLAKTGAVVLLVLVVLFLAYRSAKKGMAARAPRTIPIDLAALEPIDVVDALDAPTAALPEGPPPPPSVQEEVADLIDAQPDEVAQLLRGWLTEKA